jgi:hypothetical protein
VRPSSLNELISLGSPEGMALFLEIGTGTASSPKRVIIGWYSLGLDKDCKICKAVFLSLFFILISAPDFISDASVSFISFSGLISCPHRLILPF